MATHDHCGRSFRTFLDQLKKRAIATISPSVIVFLTRLFAQLRMSEAWPSGPFSCGNKGLERLVASFGF